MGYTERVEISPDFISQILGEKRPQLEILRDKQMPFRSPASAPFAS
jgi:hypothetical protein